MRFVLAALRIFLGLFLLANGLNFWFHWLPITPPDSETATRLMDGLVFSGLFGVVKYVEVLAGVLLLANRFVPLMLVVSFPVIFMTFILDTLIGPTIMAWLAGSAPIQHLWAKLLDATFFGGAVIVMQVYLMLSYIDSYRPMLRPRAAPTNWEVPQ